MQNATENDRFPFSDPVQGPWVMGILNATPDSFSDGGRHALFEDAVSWADRMVGAGAKVVDVGGESTRPGAAPVGEEEEARRVVPLVKAIRRRHPGLEVSVDTWKSSVARLAIEAGATMVNDVSGLRFDPEMGRVAACAGAWIVLSHLTGDTPDAMHRPMPQGTDPVAQVVQGLAESIRRAEEAGIRRERIILDPGIGFGKTTEQNLEILRRLPEIKGTFGLPILVGASRKRFLQSVLSCASPLETGDGDAAISALCAERGVDGLRVHDVGKAVAAARVGAAFKGNPLMESR